MTTNAPTLPVMMDLAVAQELASVTEYDARAWQNSVPAKVWNEASKHQDENSWTMKVRDVVLLVGVEEIGHGQQVYRVRVDAGYLYRKARAALAQDEQHEVVSATGRVASVHPNRYEAVCARDDANTHGRFYEVRKVRH